MFNGVLGLWVGWKIDHVEDKFGMCDFMILLKPKRTKEEVLDCIIYLIMFLLYDICFCHSNKLLCLYTYDIVANNDIKDQMILLCLS